MLKIKGAKISGQSQTVEVTQVTEIEGAPGVDDIRKIAMPMPFNPPSEVLFKLVGFLTDAAKGVVTTSEEKIAELNANTPVGTTQAMIEQGSKVFSAIHARLHDSQSRVLKVLQRINRWYLEEMRMGDIVQELDIRREDFNRNTDVIPVSDPHIFSETQRMAQTQAVMAYMDKYPDLFDRRAVVSRALKQMKIPNVQELMPATAEPMEINAAEENAAMTIGRAAFAYPHQNQLAHIQSHLDFALNPMLGSNPIIAPAFLPAFLEHFKQHLMLWYLGHMNGYVEESLGRPVKDYDIAGITGEIDKLYALASQHTQMDAKEAFAKVMPEAQTEATDGRLGSGDPPDIDGRDQATCRTRRERASDTRGASEERRTGQKPRTADQDRAERIGQLDRRTDQDCRINARRGDSEERAGANCIGRARKRTTNFRSVIWLPTTLPKWAKMYLTTSGLRWARSSMAPRLVRKNPRRRPVRPSVVVGH